MVDSLPRSAPWNFNSDRVRFFFRCPPPRLFARSTGGLKRRLNYEKLIHGQVATTQVATTLPNFHDNGPG